MTLESSAALFACSPRAGGNSDTAISMLSEGVASAGGPVSLFRLRDHLILPCIGCGGCERSDRCVLEEKDDCALLFQALLQAPVLLFASPVFFYHVPAMFKAWIDRGQSYFVRAQRRDPYLLSLPPRRAHMVMVAGRPTGEKLFEGSFLTMKYFLKPFNISLGETLVFRGKDAPGDLADDAAAVKEIREFGRRGWMER
jgi:hypothetical protein